MKELTDEVRYILKQFLIVWFISIMLLAGCSTVETLGTDLPLPTNTPSFAVPSQLPALTATQLPTPQALAVSPTPEEAAQTPAVLMVNADQFPAAGNYTWEVVASGFNQPLWLTDVPGDSMRLIVVEQGGRVYVINPDGSWTVFLDISSKISTSGSEQGLLGLAFHPDYEGNNWFFVNYTDQIGDTVIARFTTGEGLDSERILLKIQQPFSNHNGGQLTFGPDGYLYIGMGDGGSADDPLRHGQNTATLHGALLRIKVEPDGTYSIPEGNPFDGTNGMSEIWAFGLRNPWRFSFDQLTGDLYIGDVGQRAREEINFVPAGSGAGANFGWSLYEGSQPYIQQQAGSEAFVMPVVEYGHDAGCSVTGGYVYRGEMPEWQGIYLYGDFCSGTVWGMLRDKNGAWQSSQLFQTQTRISSFGIDSEGEVYLIDYQGGEVYILNKK